MGEPTKSTFPKQQRSKTVISTGKAGGGGGIAVGIIFLGGAVASAAAAAAFLIRRRLRKSTGNTKNCNHDRSTPSAEIPYKFLEDKNTNQADGLSNGTAKTGIHENDHAVISDQSFFQDQKYKAEANGGKGDPVSDGEQLVHSNSPNGLVVVSSLQFDTSPLEEEESPLPIVRNQTLLQPKHVADRLSVEEIEMIQEDDSIDAALVDQGTGKEKQNLENSNGEETKINCCPDKDMREFSSQEAAETTKVEQRTNTVEQSGKEQENPSRCGQESERTGNLSPTKDQRLKSEESSLAFETVEVIENIEALDAAVAGRDKSDTMTQMTVVHSLPCTENFGANSRNEKLETSHDNLGEGNIPILLLAEEENKCDHHDSSLNIGANKKTEGNETLEAIDVEEHRGAVTSTSEGGQRKCFVGSPTTEIAEVMEKFEVAEEAEARDTDIGGFEESQATGEAAQFPHDIASAKNLQKLHTEKPITFSKVDLEDNSVPDELTDEDSSYENSGAASPNISLTEVEIPAQLRPEIGRDEGFVEIQLTAEAAEARKENVANEPATEGRVVESEDSPMQFVEKQKNLNCHTEEEVEEVEGRFQVNGADKVTIEEHNLMRPEEDSPTDEGDDDADEANMAVKVEDNSEGTGDSSVESSGEPIWPAESLGEVSMEVKELKMNEQKEKEQMEEDQSMRTHVPVYPQNIDSDGIIDNDIHKGNDHKSNSQLTFLERVMLELAEQTHQPTYSQKLRGLAPAILALSWSLCFWHFGPPFLKISLIVVLIKILSKIQGF